MLNEAKVVRLGFLGPIPREECCGVYLVLIMHSSFPSTICRRMRI